MFERTAFRALRHAPTTLADAPAALRVAVRRELGPAKGVAASRASGSSQPAELHPASLVANDNFGTSVAVSGSIAVVGAWIKQPAGAAYVFVESGTKWSLQSKLVPADAPSGAGFGISVAVSGTTVVVGAWGAANMGAAYVFVQSGSTWSQQAKLTAPDGAAGDRFGTSVSIAGNTAAVGDYEYANGTGAAYVFVRSGTTWTQQAELDASDASTSAFFGASVAVSGQTVMVGAPGKSSRAGALYVFTRSGGVWTQGPTLTGSDTTTSDDFGSAVSLSGTTAVVGAVGKNNATGAAYVFARSSSTWFQTAKLTASDAATSDEFGTSVAVSGASSVLVGAAFKDSSTGAAYLFERQGTTWLQEARLRVSDGAEFDGFGSGVALAGSTALVGAPGKNSSAGAAYAFLVPTQEAKLAGPTPASNDLFGYSVALAGSTAVVGAPGRTSSTGAAYVFVQSGSSWIRQATLTATDGAAGDDFGYSVAISSGTAVVGAYTKNAKTGAAYVFVRSGTSWSQQAKLTASDAAAGDEFGDAVAVSGTTAIVGAWGRSSPIYEAGAAYVFTQSGGVWTQQTKLVPADTAASDSFGTSVAMAGTTAVIGAYSKSSFTGAAYVFALSAGTWYQQAKLTASDAAANDNFGWSVAISGATAVVGAYAKNSYLGAAYVFVQSAGVWSQQAKLTAADPASNNDFFGWSVGIAGPTVVVGAVGKSSFAGAAYAFVRSGTAWSQQAKLVPADGVANDYFGHAVAVGRATALIGAFGHNSSAGSVYVYANP